MENHRVVLLCTIYRNSRSNWSIERRMTITASWSYLQDTTACKNVSEELEKVSKLVTFSVSFGLVFLFCLFSSLLVRFCFSHSHLETLRGEEWYQY